MSVSLNPRDFVQGGLIDDVDVVVLDSRFIATDYDGSLPSPSALALQLKFGVLGDDSGAEHLQLFSAGNVADFAPDPETDGVELVQNGSRASLTKNSNLGLFLQSMADQGANLDPLNDGNVSVLNGAKFHIKRVPAPKREGLAATSIRSDGREREKTIVVCTKIISLPWDRKNKPARVKGALAPAANPAANPTAKTSTTASVSTPASAPASSADGGYDDDIITAAIAWIGEELDAAGSITLKQLRLRGMRQIKNFGLKPGKDANQFLDYVCGAEFLTASAFAVDGEGNVTL